MKRSKQLHGISADAPKGVSAFFVHMGLLVLLASLLGGCVTVKQGDQMRGDIKSNAIMLETNRKETRELEKKLATLNEGLNLLDSRFEEYLNISREKAAGTSVTLDQFKHEIQRLQGLIEQVRYELDVTRRTYEEKLAALQGAQKTAPVPENKVTPPPGGTPEPDQKTTVPIPAVATDKDGNPTDKKEHFRYARNLLKSSKNFVAGRKSMRAFLKKYPKDRLADDGLYLIGKSFFDERRYNEAIAEFQGVMDTYPKGDMVDDATFMLGECFVGLGLKSDAKVFYLQVKQTAKDKGLRKKAEARLKKLP